jgi:uncharacterized protein YqeY
MKLYQRIKDDQLVARKTQQKIKASLLTTLMGELGSDVIGSTTGNLEITDDMVVAKVKKFMKSLYELVEAYNLGSKSHTAALIEIQVLESYLPKQLTEGELTDIIKECGAPNMGAVMGYLKSNYAGLYDGRMASTIAKGLF